MKIFTAIILILIVTNSFSQKKGVIKYEITVVEQDTSYQSKMTAALLGKSEFTFIFKRKSKSYVELKAGSFFNFTTIFDYKKGIYLRLISDQENKTAHLDKIIILPDSIKNKLSTYTLHEDTMTIIGFKCKKATFKSKYGELTCWYTNELNYNFKKLEFIDIDVPGLPLYFMTTSGKVTMTYKAVKFEKLSRKYRKLLSTDIPEGYITGPKK
jgi:GLPGLI family protein